MQNMQLSFWYSPLEQNMILSIKTSILSKIVIDLTQIVSRMVLAVCTKNINS